MGVLRQIAAWLVVSGCYAPRATVGAPCGEGLSCPSDQLCDVAAPGGPTCVVERSVDAAIAQTDDAALEDATTPIDAATTPDDAMTLAGPGNDLPANAIDISAGGTFTWDPTNATDQVASSCAAAPGPDVFFSITLTAPEVIYLHTFGSSANSVIAVFSGTCTQLGAETACVDDSCGVAQSHGAWNLAAGTHCIVIDQVGTAGGTAATLSVARGNRAGDPLVGASGTVSGNTCNDDNSNSAGCGSEPARDHHYFLAACPGTAAVHLETCNAATWDTVLQLRNNANSSLRCVDDSCGVRTELDQTVTGPGLFWAIIDGFDECGAYTLAYTIQ